MTVFPNIHNIREYLRIKGVRYETNIRSIPSRLGDFDWFLTLRERPPIGYQVFTRIAHNRTRRTQRTKFVSRSPVAESWVRKMERLSVVLADTNVKVVFE